MNANKDERPNIHEEYYGQFVNAAALSIVARFIGTDRIKNSTDPHFNDIPLKEWDNIDCSIRTSIDTKLFKACNNTTYAEKDRHLILWCNSDAISIAKAAARIIKAETATANV